MTIMQLKRLHLAERKKLADGIGDEKDRQAFNLMFCTTKLPYCKCQTWKKAALMLGLDADALRDRLTAYISAVPAPAGAGESPQRPVSTLDTSKPPPRKRTNHALRISRAFEKR